ncbi:MAG TPA: alpha/beta fold hydrolase [Burkholderiaceae bacterium]|nr:alpha/beta fold hydrolase [Burkholderiaceae bacterium]
MESKTIRTALPLVMLHGLRSTPREFDLIALTLRGRGIQLITPHIDGYSLDPRPRRTSWRQWQAAASAAIGQVVPRGQPFVLGGLCAGGLLAAALTLEGAHRVAGLAMLSPTFDYDGWSQTRWRHLRTLGYALGLARWIRVAEREPFGVKNAKIRGWVAREMRLRASSASGPSSLPLWAIREVDRLKDWVRVRLPSLRTRTLVMHARDDDVCTLASVQRAMPMIAATHKRLVVLDDSYHMITIDNDRHKVADELFAFSTAHATTPIGSQHVRYPA